MTGETNPQRNAKKNSWIHNIDPRDNPRVRLVCCPYAGASATAYGALSGSLPESTEALSVQYPGRPGNREDPPVDDVRELADRTVRELEPWLDAPVAVFGHSFGSVVAFEVARRLEAAGHPPLHLVVSGRRSPSDGLGAQVPRTDEDIVSELRELGSLPARLFERPKYLEPVLAVVKNDYRANSRYLADSGASVACPITFLLAESDPYVANGGEQGWARHTSAGFRIRRFPGGHFFLNHQVANVARHLAEIIGAH